MLRKNNLALKRPRLTSRAPADRQRQAPTPSEGSVVEKIIKQIRDRVQSGQFAPGQRLVEADLQRLFEVSRGPVREAIRRLTAEGILDKRHNIGAAVRDLSPAEVINIFSIREALEGLAARMAAQNIHLDDNRKRLIALERDFAVGSATPLTYINYNDRFHSLIIKLSGNDHLVRLESQFSARIYRLQVDTASSSPPFMSIKEHKAIVRAILDQHSAKAEVLMRRHIRANLKRILQGMNAR